MEPWKCYAKPAKYNGRTCGHENTTGGVFSYRGLSREKLVCCEGCGCSKVASDAREKLAREGKEGAR